MTRVFYLHYNRDEALERVRELRAAGYTVSYHYSSQDPPRFPRKNLPDIVIVSLERLPSHARRLVEWLWEAKYRQAIPVVFVGGDPQKVAAVRKRFPAARFCEPRALLQLIESARNNKGKS